MSDGHAAFDARSQRATTSRRRRDACRLRQRDAGRSQTSETSTRGLTFISKERCASGKRVSSDRQNATRVHECAAQCRRAHWLASTATAHSSISTHAVCIAHSDLNHFRRFRSRVVAHRARSNAKRFGAQNESTRNAQRHAENQTTVHAAAVVVLQAGSKAVARLV